MKLRSSVSATAVLLLTLFSTALSAGNQNDWPVKIERDNVAVVIYQPQIESLTANKLEARAAVSVTDAAHTTPVFGAMWFDCNISTDLDERTVALIDLNVSAAKFPDMDQEDIRKLSAELEKEIPGWDLVMSLDQLLADLDMSEIAVEQSAGLNNTPPEIIFTTTPSVLVILDGDPIFQGIEKTNYQRVLNTPFFVVKDTKNGNYYLNGGKHWYISGNMDQWAYTTKVPKKLAEIAEEALDTGVDGYASGEDQPVGEGAEEGVVPEIILRTTPAELLQSDGEPKFASIEGTSILYMTNTADDILMNIETQHYFVLVSGRWYQSASITDGPWVFVEPDKVPAGFADIPAESDMGSVRSSVAGTQEAKEALLENQIPQTAEVDRNEAKLEVTYDGKPIFEPVGKTGMKYAVNTEKSVLLIDKRYFCCDNAIWFESLSANGPWVVCTSVPEQVQEIPPESPVYNVKYVYIYDYTPSVVYVGYTPGYVNSYVYRGCVYYGTGYYYHPWYGTYYYPRPVTYGFNVHWNPYTGWGFSYGVSYGWMTVGWGSPYHGWWGPAGYRHGYHYGYHHGYSSGYRAGYYAGQKYAPRPTPYSNRTAATNNVYKNRSQGVARTGNVNYDPKTGNRVTADDRSARPSAQPANRDNNVYTDRDGNVYRRDGDSWNKVDNSASRPSTGQQPATRETRPSTGQQPANIETRPSTGQQPANRDTRPSTGQQPANRDTRPSTGQQPANRDTRPSTGQQPTTRDTRPSTGQQPSARPSQPSQTPNQNLNRDYNSRNRGAERSQQYNQNRNNYQYSRPSPSQSGGARPTATPSRSGSGARRR